KRREVEAQFEGLEAAATSDVEGPAAEEPVAEGEAVAGDGGKDQAEAAQPSEAALPYALPGVGVKTVRKLVDAGLATVEAPRDASVEQLSEIPGIGAKTAEKILAAAREQ